jgi:molybdate transport system permease protein
MIGSAFRVSCLVVAAATLWVGVFGTLLGLFLAKRHFPGKEFLDSLITLPMILPPTVTGYYLIVLLGRRGLIGAWLFQLSGLSLAFTWQAAALAAGIMALPLMVKSARAAVEGVDARYEMVSLSLGKSRLATLLHVTLPLAAKGLLAGLVLSFARALGEFGATLMLAGNIPGKTQTMPLAIYEAVVSGDDRSAKILAGILTLFSVVVIYLTNVLTRPRKAH